MAGAYLRTGLVATAALWLIPFAVAAQEPDMTALSWMQGCWLAGSEESGTEEVWMAPRGGLMVAMARSVREGRATGFEFVTVRGGPRGLVFTANPSGQEPADFAVTVADTLLLRVENAGHDFPRKIEYHRFGTDSLVAKVYGEVAGEPPAFELRYGRSGCTEPDTSGDEE